MGEDARHVFLGFAHGQPADGETVEADGFEAVERFVAQFFVHASLDDAEQRVAVAEAVERIARAPRPAFRQPHRLRGFLDARGPGRAFVENHHNIGVERRLNLHRGFRRQHQARAVDGAGETHALLADLAERAEAEYLEPSGIGEDGFVPGHESVQTPMRGHDFQSRPQPQVEGIAQANLRARLRQHRRSHGFDGAVSAHGHENGRLHDAVNQAQAASARGAVRGKKFKSHRKPVRHRESET